MIDLKVVMGGMLLGLSVGGFLLLRGRILGCSGLVYKSVAKFDKDSIFFLLGMFSVGLLYNFLFDVPNPRAQFDLGYFTFILGGLLVGIGTYLGNGCTSGHGLCGLSLTRKRSIVAVSIFFPVAIITAWLVH